jgi:hypothetical protein
MAIPLNLLKHWCGYLNHVRARVGTINQVTLVPNTRAKTQNFGPSRVMLPQSSFLRLNLKGTPERIRNKREKSKIFVCVSFLGDEKGISNLDKLLTHSNDAMQVTSPTNSTFLLHLAFKLASDSTATTIRPARCHTLRMPNFAISREAHSTTSKATLMCPLEVTPVGTQNLSS